MIRMTKKQVIAALKAEQKKIARIRDTLGELVCEVEDTFDDCDGAVDEIGRAIEALSKLQ